MKNHKNKYQIFSQKITAINFQIKINKIAYQTINNKNNLKNYHKKIIKAQKKTQKAILNKK